MGRIISGPSHSTERELYLDVTKAEVQSLLALLANVAFAKKQHCLRRRRDQPTAAKPAPNRARVDGSGTEDTTEDTLEPKTLNGESKIPALSAPFDKSISDGM
jgi:hypothetical protein